MGETLDRSWIDGFLVMEYIPHDAGFGREILLGINWSRDCGPILTVGPGGGEAEYLTNLLKPDLGATVWAADTELATPEEFRRSLGKLSLAGPLDRLDRASVP